MPLDPIEKQFRADKTVAHACATVSVLMSAWANAIKFLTGAARTRFSVIETG
jgi:hypothetical protein